MKTSISIITFTLFSLILLSCQPQKSNPRLAEAHDYHKQAGQVRENLAQQLSNLEEDSLMGANVEEFRQALKEWDEAWVEVPGFEHDHEHDHEHGKDGHDHSNHKSAPNIGADEHLELQKHLLEEIKDIEKSFNDLRMKVLN